MNNGTQHNSYQNQSSGGSNLTDAVVDTMVRWPMRMTGATMDLMMQGVQRMTGGTRASGSYANGSTTDYESSGPAPGSSTGSGSGSSWTSPFTGGASGGFDQDLSGDDLKYVIWSIVFTKPGHECILQEQQEELVNYSADPNTYAAVKIAKFLDSARHGHTEKPASWGDRGYPDDMAETRAARHDSTATGATAGSSAIGASSSESPNARGTARAGAEGKGWRIPSEDQKYITFLYKVDRRLPRHEEVARVERITVERNTRVV